MKRRVVLFLFLISTAMSMAQTAAFPGAEGAGMYATGGRGGRVLTVGSLADDGSVGTLRWAVEQQGPRIVVFAVSGWIDLQSDLRIVHPDITIAGQTAPGGGIGIRNYRLNIRADNVILRYFRSRFGDKTGSEDDAINGYHSDRVIIDHCSFSWSIDECASLYGNTHFTMQWCVIAESLRCSAHRKGNHGYGGIWGGQGASFHHNLMAHHSSRTPRLCGSRYTNRPDLERVDLRNNVFYNWGPVNGAYAGEGGVYNIVNNYYKPGASTVSKNVKVASRIFQPNYDNGANKNRRGTWGKFYVAGNYFDATSPHMLPQLVPVLAEVNADNWKGIHPYDTSAYWNGWQTIRSDSAFCMPGRLHTDSPAEAYRQVLRHAGASLVRDAVDARIVEEVRKGTYTYEGSRGSRYGLIDSQQDVGGWPDLKPGKAPVDTDGDGMPDAWEKKHGLDPRVDDSALYSLHREYTNIEMYLNEIVEMKAYKVQKVESLVDALLLDNQQ